MQKCKSHRQPSRVLRMSKTDAAWLAGFFDGEGSIARSRVTNGHSRKQYEYWKLSIPNTSKETLLKVVRITGIGKLFERPKVKKHHKRMWVWQSHAIQEIVDVGRQIIPYLTIHRKIKNFNSALV